MADNTQLNANSSSGDLIATDDIAGVKHQRVKVQYGIDGSATDVSTGTPLPVTSVTGVPGLSGNATAIRSSGERNATSLNVLGNDVWQGNELTPLPTNSITLPIPADAGEQMTIVSESSLDALSNVGAEQITIQYLDAAGLEQSETINMAGQTPVTTVATNIRFINEMYVSAVGSNTAAVGHIKIYRTGTPGRVYNMMPAGSNTATNTAYMVPANKALVITNWHVSEIADRRTVFRIRTTDIDGVITPGIFHSKGSSSARRTSTGNLDIKVPVPALSMVKITAYVLQAAGEVAVGWNGELFDI